MRKTGKQCSNTVSSQEFRLAAMSTKLTIADDSGEFVISWQNLGYTVKKPAIDVYLQRFLQRKDFQAEKAILKRLNGECKSGQLMAVMGPSGAGKSTLLECICGIRREGKTGKVDIIGNTKVNVAIIPQYDTFFTRLTVRESLLFASKLQITSSKEGLSATESFHRENIDKIIKDLGLDRCKDVPIGNLSGGQKKQLSIAQELVSKPNILILDEPTSGLDSTMCYQTIKLLHTLTQQKPPIAIMATIHQPSAKVFELFHSVYVISRNGRCIFNGAPSVVVNYLSRFELLCPSFYNPADYLIEVASGDYGNGPIEQMEIAMQEEAPVVITLDPASCLETPAVQSHNFYDAIKIPDFPFFLHVGYLTKRALICTVRNPVLFAFQLFLYTLTALFVGILFFNLGRRGACPPDLTKGVQPSDFQRIQEAILEETEDVTNNARNVFFGLIFLQIGGMLITTITFPLTIKTVRKENTNGWYSAFSYYVSLYIADISFRVLFVLIFGCFTYVITLQPLEFNRFVRYQPVLILVSNVAFIQGLLIGIIFVENIVAAVFIAPTSSMPFILFSGMILRYGATPDYLKPLTFLSYMRYGGDACLISLYGYFRCGLGTGAAVEFAKQKLTIFLATILRIAVEEDEELRIEYSNAKNLTKSLTSGILAQVGGNIKIDDEGNIHSAIMTIYDIADDYYLPNVAALVLYILILHVVCFYLFKKAVSLK